jgi:hypothetical protein
MGQIWCVVGVELAPLVVHRPGGAALVINVEHVEQAYSNICSKTIDGWPHGGRLDSWGRCCSAWMGLLVWDEQVVDHSQHGQRASVQVSGWLQADPASYVAPAASAC